MSLEAPTLRIPATHNCRVRVHASLFAVLTAPLPDFIADGDAAAVVGTARFRVEVAIDESLGWRAVLEGMLEPTDRFASNAVCPAASGLAGWLAGWLALAALSQLSSTSRMARVLLLTLLLSRSSSRCVLRYSQCRFWS